MINGRYHKDIFWNYNLESGCERLINHLNVSPTYHSKCRLAIRKRGQELTMQQACDIINKHEQYKVYSADYKDGEVWAIGCRFNFNKEFDLVAIVTETKLLTCWLNRKNDYHKHLDTSKYVYGDIFEREVKV